jgi:AraC-like DNA-binding protein
MGHAARVGNQARARRDRETSLLDTAWLELGENPDDVEIERALHGKGSPIIRRLNAQAVGASKRTLARRMHSVLGKAPLSPFQSLRVERAVHLLKTGNASVEEVAARVGYSEGATLRSLLRRRLKLGVKEIRSAR